jgi:hypothetical protein
MKKWILRTNNVTMCLTLFENLDFLVQNTNMVYFKYDWSF